MLTTFIKNMLARLRATGDKLTFIGPTLARLTVGLVFIGTGWGKLHTPPRRHRVLRQPAHPRAGIQRHAWPPRPSSSADILVLVGLGTRLASLPLAFTMVVAILTAKRADITGLTVAGGLRGVELPRVLHLAGGGRRRSAVARQAGVLASRAGSRHPVELPKPLLRPQS